MSPSELYALPGDWIRKAMLYLTVKHTEETKALNKAGKSRGKTVLDPVTGEGV